MLSNYCRIAFRNLWKYKGFSAINIAGLTLGIASSLLILLWVQYEKSVDAFHVNNDRLYKVYEREYYDGKVDGNYETPGPMAEELKKIFPEVEYAASMQYQNKTYTLKAGNKILKAEGNAAGKDWFKMFSYPLLAGNSDKVLTDPKGIVLCRSLAEKLFSSAEAAMGQTVRCENMADYIVTGVYADLPPNVSHRYDYLISWQAFLQQHPFATQWINSGPFTYIQLKAGASATLLEQKLKHLIRNYTDKDKNGYTVEYGLQPFRDVYLHDKFKNGIISGGRIEYVQLFSLVAIFILLIACINFMNLSTARSIKRAREIGVRKVNGAGRTALVLQFLGEALLLTLLAALLALILVSMVLPAFNALTGYQIKIPYDNRIFWTQLFALVLTTGILAGCYPAILLSSFNPLQVLKGSHLPGTRTHLLRKGLVVFQFVLSMILIIGTLVVSKQISYIQTRNLGYDRTNLLMIPLEGGLLANFNVFKDQALQTPAITEVSQLSDTPTLLDQSTTTVTWPGKQASNLFPFFVSHSGYDFVKTMKLRLTGGRDFSPEYPSDSTACILNETAVRKIGFINPVGKSITLWGIKRQIVGVIRDFNFKPLHEPIQPMIIVPELKHNSNILVRIQPGQTEVALKKVAALCKQLNPSFPFSYRFINDDYNKQYVSETIVGKLSGLFAGLAIIIACLGLLGLTMFTTEQRTREIGIRKVLGASVGAIFRLLSFNYLGLILISMVIACPLAWYVMHQWLSNYAYSTTLHWWIFAIAGLIVLMIALLMISFQTIKAAIANPVKSLRTE
ncbi:ABC transporter permease [Chitinophaga sp. HK235]|uniref:ABC transporter permease n=1 Tax=Chitinophaga sp. HK235 TaxID=2952571 RepID=UPI001BA69185|nr:ABC transporter permease [Chitinophaga sp. HK235]